MALVECPECGNGVSAKAAACPKCGYPFDDDIARCEPRRTVTDARLSPAPTRQSPPLPASARTNGGATKANTRPPSALTKGIAALVIVGVIIAVAQGSSDADNQRHAADPDTSRVGVGADRGLGQLASADTTELPPLTFGAMQSGRWLTLGRSHGILSAIDSTSAQVLDDGAIRAWIRWIYSPVAAGGLKYTLAQVDFDCGGNTERIVASTDYDARGNILRQDARAGGWDEIVPDTPGSQMLEGACQLRKRK